MLLSKENATRAQDVARAIFNGEAVTEDERNHLLGFCNTASRNLPWNGQVGSVAADETERRPIKEKFWWAIHNLVAHPLCEVCHWVGLQRFGNRFHDWTVPVQKAVTVPPVVEPVSDYW